MGYRGLSAAVQIHHGVSSWQQVERHGRAHSMIRGSNSSSGRGHGGSISVYCFTSRSIMVRLHRGVGGGGAGLVNLVRIFLQWVHLSTRILFLFEYGI